MTSLHHLHHCAEPLVYYYLPVLVLLVRVLQVQSSPVQSSPVQSSPSNTVCPRSPIKKLLLRVTHIVWSHPPPFDNPTERYINESDIPIDCLEPISSEANPEDTDLNPVTIETPFPTASKRERVKKESDHEKAKNQLQNAKESTPEAIVIDDKTVFSAEKILKHRKRNGKVEYLAHLS